MVNFNNLRMLYTILLGRLFMVYIIVIKNVYLLYLEIYWILYKKTVKILQIQHNLKNETSTSSNHPRWS